MPENMINMHTLLTNPNKEPLTQEVFGFYQNLLLEGKGRHFIRLL